MDDDIVDLIRGERLYREKPEQSSALRWITTGMHPLATIMAVMAGFVFASLGAKFGPLWMLFMPIVAAYLLYRTRTIDIRTAHIIAYSGAGVAIFVIMAPEWLVPTFVYEIW